MLTHHLIKATDGQLTATSYPSLAGLNWALNRLPEDTQRYVVVMEPNDLKALTNDDLRDVANLLRPKAIKGFRTKEEGVARVWSLLTTNKDIEVMDETEDNKAEGSADTPQPSAEADQPQETNDMAATKAKRGVKKEKAPRKGRSGTYPDDAKIKVLTAENPKRKGSNAFKAFGKYANGMTVGEAKAKGVKAADIAYDVKHEFIRVG